MAYGYSRVNSSIAQSTYFNPTATVVAQGCDAEFNTLQNAFHQSTGHDHSGQYGLGPKILANGLGVLTSVSVQVINGVNTTLQIGGQKDIVQFGLVSSGISINPNNAPAGVKTGLLTTPQLAVTDILVGPLDNSYVRFLHPGGGGVLIDQIGTNPNKFPGVLASASHNLQLGNGNLATNATAGHILIPQCDGAPTGTPDGGIGAYMTALIYDWANHKLWVFDPVGSWKGVVLA